jgi:hypothetical protein
VQLSSLYCPLPLRPCLSAALMYPLYALVYSVSSSALGTLLRANQTTVVVSPPCRRLYLPVVQLAFVTAVSPEPLLRPRPFLPLISSILVSSSVAVSTTSSTCNLSSLLPCSVVYPSLLRPVPPQHRTLCPHLLGDFPLLRVVVVCTLLRH